jgi:hypothetical protein
VWNQAARLNWQKIYIQQNAYRNGPDCGADFWFTFEYWSDGRNCTILVWNGPQKAEDKRLHIEAQKEAVVESTHYGVDHKPSKADEDEPREKPKMFHA